MRKSPIETHEKSVYAIEVSVYSRQVKISLVVLFI